MRPFVNASDTHRVPDARTVVLRIVPSQGIPHTGRMPIQKLRCSVCNALLLCVFGAEAFIGARHCWMCGELNEFPQASLRPVAVHEASFEQAQPILK